MSLIEAMIKAGWTNADAFASDTISRQAAIDAVNEKYGGFIISSSTCVVNILNELPSVQPKTMSVILDVQKITKHKSDFSDLPPAQPERKTGHWIDGSIPTYKACSECGYEERYADENNYCPECGAYMKGVKQ